MARSLWWVQSYFSFDSWSDTESSASSRGLRPTILCRCCNQLLLQITSRRPKYDMACPRKCLSGSCESSQVQEPPNWWWFMIHILNLFLFFSVKCPSLLPITSVYKLYLKHPCPVHCCIRVPGKIPPLASLGPSIGILWHPSNMIGTKYWPRPISPILLTQFLWWNPRFLTSSPSIAGKIPMLVKSQVSISQIRIDNIGEMPTNISWLSMSPSGNLTVCYWKWWFIVDLRIEDGDVP